MRDCVRAWATYLSASLPRSVHWAAQSLAWWMPSARCTPGASPSCTGGLWSGLASNTTTYASTFPNSNVSDNEIGKIDYRLNSKNMLNGMFWNGNYNGLGEDSALVNPAFEFQAHIRAVTSVENWIWTPSSSLVNEARFGLNHITFI